MTEIIQKLSREKIVRVAEMSDELAVALGLALFCTTEHRENFA